MRRVLPTLWQPVLLMALMLDVSADVVEDPDRETNTATRRSLFDSERTQLGAKAGIAIATAHGHISELGNDFSSREAWAVGAFLTFRVTEYFSIQPEFLHIQKGARVDGMPHLFVVDGGQLSRGTVDLEFKIDYNEVPILARFDIPILGDVFGSLCAGPAFSFKTGAEVEAVGEAPGISIVEETEFTQDIDYADIGIVLGGGIGVVVDRVQLFLEGRYNMGLNNVDATPGHDVLENRVWTLMLGFSYSTRGL